MNTEKVYFLDDEPKKDLQEDDAFGHVYYARTLYEIIEKTETTEPYTIGLFGKWGLGKTSIINELERLINKNSGQKGKSGLRQNYKILKLDAWEYSDQNFRREFLLDLGDHFQCREEVCDKITTRRIIEKKEAPKYDWKWFKQLLKQFVIFFSFWLGPFLLLNKLGGSLASSAFWSFLIAGSAGVATIFRDNIKELFKFQTTIHETQPAVHPDQFKEVFKFIIQKKSGLTNKYDRLVIVLDNLDRVKEEVVIQILGAIKTFLKEEKCIYILPCDDKGLKEHIVSMRAGAESSEGMTGSQANEYLRKFFQTTLNIRPLLAEDLDTFTDEVLKKLIIFDLPIYEYEKSEVDKQEKDENARKCNRDEVALVLRAAIAKNPRRIIQLANKLSANYLLAQERGRENPQIRFNILTNLGFLAKVTVIEEEWPEFYSFILDYPDALRQLRNYFITEDEDLMPPLLKEKLEKNESNILDEWNRDLKDFLKQTSTIYSDYVSDFLLFKQRQTIPLIANYHKFRDAAMIRQVEVVEEIIKNDNTSIDAAFKELLNELNRQSRFNNIPSSLSLMYCIAKIFHLIPGDNTQLRNRVADRISETLSSKLFASSILDVGLPELLTLLHYSQRDSNKEQIISSLINGIKFTKEESKITQFILEQLIMHHSLLTSENKRQIHKKLAEASQNDDLLKDLREVSNRIFETNEGFVRDLIPQEFYIKNINMLQQPDLASDVLALTLAFISSYLPFFESSTMTHFMDIIAKHLGQTENTLSGSKFLALNCITTTPPELIPDSSRKSIVGLLANTYNKLGNRNHKNEITKCFLHLLSVLAPEEQQPYHSSLLDTINNSDPPFLLDIINTLQNKRAPFHDLNAILVSIKGRVKSHISNAELRGSFFKLADTLKNREHIQELIISIWEQPDHALLSLDEAKVFLKPEEFRNIVITLIEKTDDLPPNQFERVLEALGSYRDMYSKQFLHTVVEELLNDWFKKPSAEARRGAKKFWQGIRDNAKDERKRFHERILEYCKPPINNNTITEEVQKIYIETLLEDHQYLSKKARDEFVKLCLRMIEAARPQSVKNYGHEVLRRLAHDKYAQQLIPEELIADLEQEQNEQDIRASLNTLREYKVNMTESQTKRLNDILSRQGKQEIIEEFKDIFLIT